MREVPSTCKEHHNQNCGIYTDQGFRGFVHCFGSQTERPSVSISRTQNRNKRASGRKWIMLLLLIILVSAVAVVVGFTGVSLRHILLARPQGRQNTNGLCSRKCSLGHGRSELCEYWRLPGDSDLGEMLGLHAEVLSLRCFLFWCSSNNGYVGSPSMRSISKSIALLCLMLTFWSALDVLRITIRMRPSRQSARSALRPIRLPPKPTPRRALRGSLSYPPFGQSRFLQTALHSVRTQRSPAS